MEGTFAAAIEALWQKLGLGRPQPQSNGALSMNVDGVELVFSTTSDGQGILVKTTIGALSREPSARARQMENILQLNLAILSLYPVLASVNRQRVDHGELELSVRSHGFSEQSGLIELLEDLLAAAAHYHPILQEGGEYAAPLLGTGANPSQFSSDTDSMMVFSL